MVHHFQNRVFVFFQNFTFFAFLLSEFSHFLGFQENPKILKLGIPTFLTFLIWEIKKHNGGM
jgi:hypothetical protein